MSLASHLIALTGLAASAVSASLPAADLGPLELEVVPAGPNHVVGVDVDLPVAGLWTFDVTARFGEFDQVVFTVQIPVSG